MFMDLISSAASNNTLTELDKLSSLKNKDLKFNQEINSGSTSDNSKSVKTFQETLNAVQNNQQTKDKQTQSKTEDLKEMKEKIQDLEKKVKELKDDPELSEQVDVEKLESLIEKLKEFIELQTASDSQVSFQTENGSEMDFSSIMNQILDEINSYLEQTSMNDDAVAQLNSLIENAEIKADDAVFQLENIANFESNSHFIEVDLPDFENVSQEEASQVSVESASVKNSETESDSESDTKVEVFDFRSEKVVNSEDGSESDTEFQDEGFEMNQNDNGEIEFKLDKDSLKTEQSQNFAENTENMETSKTTVTEIPVMNESGELEFVQIIEEGDVFSVNTQSSEIKNVAQQSYVSFSNPINRANLESLMQGIAGKVVVTMEEGSSELRMKLFPPELGQMNMKLSFEDGQLLGKIVVQTQEAKMLFDQNMTDLQNAMQESGIDIGSLDVSLSDSGNPDDDFSIYPEMTAMTGKEGVEGDLVQLIETRGSLYDTNINLLA